MSFASTVHRARADFLNAPRLELTLPQAGRQWGLGADDCRFVVDALVDAGFLAWTARRTIVRRGHQASLSLIAAPDISARSTGRADNTV
jgi:hypothetical protein